MSGDVVKSVGRVLEVLDYFRQTKTPQKANDIGLSLNYPKSSTNALLKSMVSLGYLSFDQETMNYFPTARVSSLGDWIPAALLGQDRMNVLKELHERTNETVTMSVRNGFGMQFTVVIPGKFPISLAVQEGFVAPMVGSAVGTAYLSTLADPQVEKFLARAKRARAAHLDEEQRSSLYSDIAAARKDGFAIKYDGVLPDTGALAVALPGLEATGTSVIGLGGLAPRIHAAESDLIEAMTSLLAH